MPMSCSNLNKKLNLSNRRAIKSNDSNQDISTLSMSLLNKTMHSLGKTSHMLIHNAEQSQIKIFSSTFFGIIIYFFRLRLWIDLNPPINLIVPLLPISFEKKMKKVHVTDKHIITEIASSEKEAWL